MMTEFITQFLEAENILTSERQVNTNNAAPDVIVKKAAERQEQIKIPKKYESDIEALKEMFGQSFLPGLCINTTLKEALRIMPRERPRVDAYRGLISFLKTKLGIELIIKSQKTREEKL